MITAFADESGNNSFKFNTQGSHFIVATVICNSEKVQDLEKQVGKRLSSRILSGDIVALRGKDRRRG